jgi:hypothetical protein
MFEARRNRGPASACTAPLRFALRRVRDTGRGESGEASSLSHSDTALPALIASPSARNNARVRGTGQLAIAGERLEVELDWWVIVRETPTRL